MHFILSTGMHSIGYKPAVCGTGCKPVAAKQVVFMFQQLLLHRG